MSYDKPFTSEFWAAELFLPVPLVEPIRFRTYVDRQALFDLWHGLEDGIECVPRARQRHRLKWMMRIELTGGLHCE